MFFALTIAAFAVTSILRLKSEECTGHTETALANAVSRRRWASWLGFTAFASTLLLIVIGLGVGIGAVTGAAGPSVVLEFTLAMLAHLPAVLMVIGSPQCCRGIDQARPRGPGSLSRTRSASECSAPLLKPPDFFADLSRFDHTVAMPLSGIEVLSLIVLTALADVLTVAGSINFRRRDLDVP